MATFFERSRPLISSRMAADDYETRRELIKFTKFAKTRNGYWLAWNPADESRVALLRPDHPKSEPCTFIESWEDAPSIEKFVEYIESGEYEEAPPGEINLFIEDVRCAGKNLKTGHPCDKTPYRCKHCGKQGCAHLKSDQCSRQCFVGATCQYCGTVGRIGELRDGRPDPDKDLKAFYRQLLDGRQNQFELKFVVSQRRLWAQIWLDDELIGRRFFINFKQLFESLCGEGEYCIFECGCGEYNCEALGADIDVHFEGGEVVWLMRPPLPCRPTLSGMELINWSHSEREYRFDRSQMIGNIADAMAAARSKLEKNHYEFHHPIPELSLEVALAQIPGEPFDDSRQFVPRYKLSLIDELEMLNREANKWGPRHGYPEVDRYPQYQRVREIGEEYCAQGGLVRMQQAVVELQARMAATPRTKQDTQLVVYGWGGIGGWAA